MNSNLLIHAGAVVNLVERVEAVVRVHGLISKGERVLVGVSGGLDSMVLLHILSRLAPVHGWQLTVAHFNHQIRGRSADADERFVQATAQKLGLPCVVGRANVRVQARARKISLEMAARQLRHHFLASTARRRRSRIVVLAHHADDQVELFLLRLLRGSSPESLAGMKWRGPSPADPNILLVRPLLTEPKSALSDWAAKNGVSFREDSTNASRDILRNRIRHELLPLLARDYQPAIDKVILRHASLASAESEFVADAARQWLISRHRSKFGSLAPALQRRVVQLQLAENGISASFDLIEHLRLAPEEAVSVGPERSVRCNVYGQLVVRRTARGKFSRAQHKITLTGRAGELRLANRSICWELQERPDPPHKRSEKTVNSEVFDADKVGNVISLRHWRPGDRFQPIGMARSVKLQDLFVNQKIPQEERGRLLVATTNAGAIFWVERLRISERYKLDKTSRVGLKWTWKGL